MSEEIVMMPNEGPQRQALESSADILLMGGARGGGKTRFLLMEPLRHHRRDGFYAVIFRRTLTNIKQVGGIQDESYKIYPHFHGSYNKSDHEWSFPEGSKVAFSHVQHESDVEDRKGMQVALLEFDEVTEFPEEMFFTLLGANRSTCGVKPYVRMTCNPDPDSWVARFIDWWIGPDGYPIPERSGVIRWYVRFEGIVSWFDSKDDAIAYCIEIGMPEQEAPSAPLSFTFVPSMLDDNPALVSKDPGYRAKLLSSDRVGIERYLKGNWKIRHDAGMVFPITKWKTEYVIPNEMRMVRAWDRAFTAGGSGARTCGVLIGIKHGRVYIGDVKVGRWDDDERERVILQTAHEDRQRFGDWVRIVIEQEPAAGKHSARITARNLSGFDVTLVPATSKKHLRWRPLASQLQAENAVIVPSGDWDHYSFISTLNNLSGDEKLDKEKLKDEADAASLGYVQLTDGLSVIDITKFQRHHYENEVVTVVGMEDEPQFSCHTSKMTLFSVLVPMSIGDSDGLSRGKSVLLTWGLWRERRIGFLLDSWHTFGGWDEVIQATRERLQRRNVRRCVVVECAASHRVSQTLRRNTAEGWPSVQVMNSDAGKDLTAEASVLQEVASKGQMSLPTGDGSAALLAELTEWTAGSTGNEFIAGMVASAKYLRNNSGSWAMPGATNGGRLSRGGGADGRYKLRFGSGRG